MAEAPRRDLGDGTEAERSRDGEEEQGRRIAKLGTAMGHGVNACNMNVGAFRGRVGFLRGQASLRPLLRVIPDFWHCLHGFVWTNCPHLKSIFLGWHANSSTFEVGMVSQPTWDKRISGNPKNPVGPPPSLSTNKPFVHVMT